MNFKITAEHKGKQFELVIGEEYEFSDSPEFMADRTKKGKLHHINKYCDENYPFCCDYKGRRMWFPRIRPIQKEESRELTHKEIAMYLVGKGVFRINGLGGYKTFWDSSNLIGNYRFCFFSDLDTDHEKWHELTTELLEMLSVTQIKEREG